MSEIKMQNMRTVGMVIYTYSTLEQRFKELWEWVEAIERWSGKSFTTYYFTPEAKRTSKAKSLTLKERERLSERLQLETPWYAWVLLGLQLRSDCTLSVVFRSPSGLALNQNEDKKAIGRHHTYSWKHMLT